MMKEVRRMQERYLELRAEEKRLMEKMEQIIAEAEDTQEDLSNQTCRKS